MLDISNEDGEIYWRRRLEPGVPLEEGEEEELGGTYAAAALEYPRRVALMGGTSINIRWGDPDATGVAYPLRAAAAPMGEPDAEAGR